MKRFLSGVIALLVALVGMGMSGTVEANFSEVIPQGSGYEATYTANIPWTMNGNNVTNVIIFEEGSGGQTKVDFPYTLVPGGVSVLSDTLNFLPTSALIVGVELTQPLVGTGKRHLVMFANDTFAVGATGKDFSQAFPPLHEQAFIDNLLSAEGGNSSLLSLLTDYFISGPLEQAAFTPGGSFTVIESSRITPATVPEPSTFLLLGAGLAGVGFLRRRMRN
jgi:PEP-CTERM motif